MEPAWALVGARVLLRGASLPSADPRLPVVRVGGVEAQVVMAGPARIAVIVPADAPGGRQAVTVDGVDGHVDLHVGTPLATGIHQVDNPVFGDDGWLFVTFSGTRGQQVPVSVFRVSPDGVKEPFLTDIVNATSMAFDAARTLHVTSRFDGVVYRVKPDRTVDAVARELGVACGIAFASDGTMFVGDRSGTVFRVGPTTHVIPFASLPPSMAAFHLAIGADDLLYVTGPTFAPCDYVYRIDRQGDVTVVSSEFGRPQGMAVDADGTLYVVDALAGGAGLFRVRPGQRRELVLSASSLVGVAFDPRGGLVVASSDSVYRLDVGVKPWRFR
ncbi:MAG: gluconolaconase [Acidobacteria bacterium]|nr:gluconolaconase [Acidobacteriota bacterium]